MRFSLYDLGDALNGANSALQNYNAIREQQDQKATLASLGTDLSGGDYKTAAAKLFKLGQVGPAVSLVEKQRQMDEFNKLYPQQPETSMSVAPVGQPMALSGATLNNAIIGQESGGNPNIGTSVNGARGIGQILPETFARFAKPGEDINKPADNLAVSQRMTDMYLQRYGDPARAAVAYFSGEGNVAPPGSPTPWKEDHKDGNGKSVSSYVSDVLGRMKGAQPVQTANSGAVATDAIPAGYRDAYNKARWTIMNPNLPESAKEAAKLDIQNIQTIAREDRAANRPTDTMKNYNEALRQGYKGTVMDFIAATKGGTTVNVGPNEGEFAKKAAAKQADRFSAISEEGDTGRNDLALISQLSSLRQTIGTGGGAAAQAWLADHGIKVGANVGDVEAYQAIVDKLTPSQRIPGSGTTSDRDMAIFKSSLPSLIRTPEGNAIVERVLSSLAQSKIARADIADRVLSGEISAKDGVAELRKLPNPFEAMKGGAGGAQPAQGQASQPQQQPNLIPEPPAGVTPEQITEQAKARIVANPAMRDAVIQQMNVWKRRIPGLVIP